MMKVRLFLKKTARSVLPNALLKVYKKHRTFRWIRNFDINQEHDLKVIQILVGKEDCVLDIGANVGLYTCFIAPWVKRIYSIEPVPETLEILESTIKQMKLRNVIPLNVAVSDKEETVMMSIHRNSSGFENYFRAKIVNDETRENERRVKVRSVTMDSQFSHMADSITFVKCDIEGHELSCLHGAKEFLEKSNAAWLIEVSGDPKEKGSSANQVFEIFSERCFMIFSYDGKSLRPRGHGERDRNFFFFQERHIRKLRDGKSIPVQPGE